MWLQEIGRYKLLTAQQEVELAMQLEAGKKAEEKLRDAEGLAIEDRVLLERAVRKGNAAHSRLVEANLGSSCRSPATTWVGGCRCSISSRKATSA
jgi:hypothetical protein